MTQYAEGLVVGIDAGTTSLKVLALDVATGHAVAEAAGEYPTSSPEPGAHQQDPADWWDVAVVALRQVLAKVDPSSVRAVGMSGHMHSLLLVDGHDEPIGPVLTWADRRVSAQAHCLAADPAFRSIAGNDVAETFTAPKLAWFAERYPGRLRDARRLVLAKDFLRFRLTGRWATDETDAAGTLLYDVHRRKWSEGLWRAAGADVGLAPEVLSPHEVAGVVTQEASAATGLPPGTPVVTGSGDVPAAVLGSGVVDEGSMSVNVGTAAQIMGISTEPDPGGGFLFVSALGEKFVIMSSLYAAGASIRWAERALLGGRPVGGAIRGVRPGCEELTYLPFMFGSTAPIKNSGARAAFIGQDVRHGIPHLARAVVEGVAFGCADAVSTVASVVGRPAQIRIVGGVTQSEEWCRTFASAVGADIEVMLVEGGSARGAAALAALGTRLWTAGDLSATTMKSRIEPYGRSDEVADAYERYRSACMRLL